MKTTPIKVFFKKLFYALMLLTEKKVAFWDKVEYWFNTVIIGRILVFVLSSFGLWIDDNKQFFSGVIVAILFNMVLGGWYHKQNKTFRWSEFFKRNLKMWAIIICTYPLLEILSSLSGGFVGDTFKVVIQIATILYPGSKALKSAYLLSNKTYPPSFIMDRIYKFEKDGNVNDLFKGKDNENTETDETD